MKGYREWGIDTTASADEKDILGLVGRYQVAGCAGGRWDVYVLATKCTQDVRFIISTGGKK
jgi:hypothetical protein